MCCLLTELYYVVRFEVIISVLLKIQVFWVFTPHFLADSNGGVQCRKNTSQYGVVFLNARIYVFRRFRDSDMKTFLSRFLMLVYDV